MSLDHDGPVPLYQQVASIIRDRIRSGEYQPNRRIPSETVLTQEYEIARATARQAIALLREEGYVYTVGQRGTFVSSRD